MFMFILSLSIELITDLMARSETLRCETVRALDRRSGAAACAWARSAESNVVGIDFRRECRCLLLKLQK